MMLDLTKCPRFTKEEETALFDRWKKHGDLAARNELIESVLPLCVRLTGYYNDWHGVDRDELVSVAFEKLVLCIDKFDPGRDRLTTFVHISMARKLRQAGLP
jgi:DNA-directed RNA polymerase specialized sigma subunit